MHARDAQGGEPRAAPFPARLSEAGPVRRLDGGWTRMRSNPDSRPPVPLDLLTWALRERSAPSAAPAEPLYASALGVHDAAAIRGLRDAFAAGYPVVKVDVMPQMSADYRDAIAELGRTARVAL